MNSQVQTIGGHRVIEITRNDVKSSLTDEVKDVGWESIRDFLLGVDYMNVQKLVHTQDTLVDYFKYYLSETLDGHVDNYSVVGDSRNNEEEEYGKSFRVDVSFTVKNMLIATRITYTIEYKTS